MVMPGTDETLQFVGGMARDARGRVVSVRGLNPVPVPSDEHEPCVHAMCAYQISLQF